MDSLRQRCATNVLAAHQIPIIALRPAVGKGALRALTYISMRTVVYGNNRSRERLQNVLAPFQRATASCIINGEGSASVRLGAWGDGGPGERERERGCRGQLRKEWGAMRPWIEWSAGIGLAATCLMFTGCGGGDVADPGSDHSAAADSASDTGEPPAPAPAGGGKAAPVVAQNKGRAASAPKEDADADDKKDAAQASSENPSATKSEGGSSTAEMLAMATGGQTGSGGAQPPAGGGAAPGQNPQPGGGVQGACSTKWDGRVYRSVCGHRPVDRLINRVDRLLNRVRWEGMPRRCGHGAVAADQPVIRPVRVVLVFLVGTRREAIPEAPRARGPKGQPAWRRITGQPILVRPREPCAPS